MTFKHKLLLAFVTIIFLPVLLCIIAFLIVGNVLALQDGARQLQNYNTLADNVQTNSAVIDSLYNEVREKTEQDPYALENKEYDGELAEKLQGYNCYILIRKDQEIYYTDNQKDANRLFTALPQYRGNSAQGAGSGYVLKNSRLIRQMDFSFSDGAQGSFFVVTQVVFMFSKKFVVAMFFAILAVLCITGAILTSWLKRSLYEPVRALNIAMNNIRDGNFEYRLQTNDKGEIGELYRNYEDMRLRLKETAEEKLEDEKHDRELISNISHDLKTPITSIKGYVEGLLDGVANTPEKQRKYLQTILNKSNDMNNLINELTLYSKIDSNRIPYNFQKINLADYFADCVEEIGMDMEARGIKLNYDNLVSPDTMIIADPEQLKRVINNIISNSVKYMDKSHQTIDIRILDEQDSVRIEIEDNGKGIAARDLPNIFDRFFRTDSSRNSAQGGSGIGLSIVRKIIEDHGGYIWATSREGVGTCMHFVIRKYKEKENPAAHVDSSGEGNE